MRRPRVYCCKFPISLYVSFLGSCRLFILRISVSHLEEILTLGFLFLAWLRPLLHLFQDILWKLLVEQVSNSKTSYLFGPLYCKGFDSSWVQVGPSPMVLNANNFSKGPDSNCCLQAPAVSCSCLAKLGVKFTSGASTA